MRHPFRVKIAIPSGTFFFLKQRVDHFGTTMPGYIRHLIWKDLEKYEKNPPPLRQMTDEEVFGGYERSLRE